MNAWRNLHVWSACVPVCSNKALSRWCGHLWCIVNPWKGSQGVPGFLGTHLEKQCFSLEHHKTLVISCLSFCLVICGCGKAIDHVVSSPQQLMIYLLFHLTPRLFPYYWFPALSYLYLTGFWNNQSHWLVFSQ